MTTTFKISQKCDRWVHLIYLFKLKITKNVNIIKISNRGVHVTYFFQAQNRQKLIVRKMKDECLLRKIIARRRRRKTNEFEKLKFRLYVWPGEYLLFEMVSVGWQRPGRGVGYSRHCDIKHRIENAEAPFSASESDMVSKLETEVFMDLGLCDQVLLNASMAGSWVPSAGLWRMSCTDPERALRTAMREMRELMMLAADTMFGAAC